jgi:ribosomal protein S18 acetylase RimI-like enzyme
VPLGIPIFLGADWYAFDIAPADLAALQALCERSADYFERITGLPPGPSEAHSLYIARPERATPGQKFLLGIATFDEQLIGVLDAISDYPEPGVCTLGLLLFEPDARGRGFGRAVMRGFAAWSGAQTIELGAAESDPGTQAFWRKLGFASVETRMLRFSDNRTMSFVVMRAATSLILVSERKNQSD